MTSLTIHFNTFSSFLPFSFLIHDTLPKSIRETQRFAFILASRKQQSSQILHLLGPSTHNHFLQLLLQKAHSSVASTGWHQIKGFALPGTFCNNKTSN